MRDVSKSRTTKEGGRGVKVFDSQTWSYRRVNTYTCMVCPGSRVKEPYSLKMARGLASTALSTQVNAITPKHTSLRILVSRWYTMHLQCESENRCNNMYWSHELQLIALSPHTGRRRTRTQSKPVIICYMIICDNILFISTRLDWMPFSVLLKSCVSFFIVLVMCEKSCYCHEIKKNEADYFFVTTMLLGSKSHTVGKPVDFLLNSVTFVSKMHLWVEQNWVFSHRKW